MVCAHLLEYSMVNGYPELRATLPLSATKNEDWFKQKTKKLHPNIRSGFWVTTRRLCPIIPGEEEQQEEIINTTSGNLSFTILSYSSSAESSPTLASRWWSDGREPCRGVDAREGFRWKNVCETRTRVPSIVIRSFRTIIISTGPDVVVRLLRSINVIGKTLMVPAPSHMQYRLYSRTPSRKQLVSLFVK